MGSPIRLIRGLQWGTCFAITRGEANRFVTAAHVLHAGVLPAVTTANVLMCDETNAFLAGPKGFNVSNLAWDEACDYVEFDSNFHAAQPYHVGPAPKPGQAVTVNGYVIMPGGAIPDCGVCSEWTGTIISIHPCGDGGRSRLALNLDRDFGDWSGMSGAPVLTEDGVVAAFQGRLKNGALVAVALT